MAIKIHNKSSHNLDIWTSMGGPLQWNNNTPKGETTVLDPGWVWVTVNAKPNSGPGNEITTGKAIVSNLLSAVGFAFGGPFGVGVLALVIAAQNTGVLSKTILPEQFREYLDAGAVEIDSDGDLHNVSVASVYGRDNDVDVEGGDVASIVKVGGSPAEGGKLKIKFHPLRIREL